jgi:hypothetical protein
MNMINNGSAAGLPKRSEWPIFVRVITRSNHSGVHLEVARTSSVVEQGIIR